MKKPLLLLVLTFVASGPILTVGCDSSKSSQDTRKATIEAGPPRSAMTPTESKRNAKAIERHKAEGD